ncbi:MAG: leucine-rich repeat protein [Clostridia bacterium]|nr:leucine-rich repeat protein [Clostridia bacterium]
MKRLFALLLTAVLLCCAWSAPAQEVDLDALMREIDQGAAAKQDELRMEISHFEISANHQSVFIDKPYVFHSDDYTIAYNIYDAQSNPVNYFYSLEDRVAATPGYKGLFNVFIVVTDNASGQQVMDNIGWIELIGSDDPQPETTPLRVEKAEFRISEDRQHIFLRRPDISGGSGSYQIAYNIYDAQSNPVNYFYSLALDVAATPGYDGLFNVFVVVTDNVTKEQDIQNIGWQFLGDNPDDWPITLGEFVYNLQSDGSVVLTHYSNAAIPTGVSITISTPMHDEVRGKPVQIIGSNAFEGHEYFNGPHSTAMTYPVWKTDFVLPSHLTLIGDSAFANNRFLSGQRLILPNTLVRINARAFEGSTGLTGELVIPASVRYIGSRAFGGCAGLTGHVYIPEGCEVAADAFAGTNLIGEYVQESWPVTLNGGTYDLIDGMMGLTQVTANGFVYTEPISGRYIEFIGDRAWILRYGRDSIPYGEIYGTLTLPVHLKWIGKEAFAAQHLIMSLVIGVELREVRENAFRDCSSLKDVYYAGTEEQWEQIAISEGNAPLRNATIHYNSTGE